jgi:hypothetical protein
MKRALLEACLCALTVFASVEARADDRAACFDAASQGQVLRDQHKLVEARDKLRLCAQPSCPKSMQSDCAAWLDTTEKAIPTVVLSARDGEQRDVLDVTVTLDGQPLATKLDGQAIAVNPGPHTFRFERADGTAATEQVLLKEGEQARSVAVVLAAAAAAPSPATPSSGSMRTVGWIVGGAGVAAVVAGLVLVVAGSGDRGDCRSDGGCPTQTALTKYNSGTPLLNAGYALLVGGGVATAAGAVLWLVSSRGAAPESPSTADVRVGLAPTGIVVAGGF